MKVLHAIAFILIIVGALNWGLVGVGGDSWNVVSYLGDLDRVVYILVGLAALFELVTHRKSCSACSSCGPKAGSGSSM